MSSYFVNFNLLWAIRINCEAFFWRFPEKPESPFFRQLFGPEDSCLLSIFPFLLFANLLQSTRQLCRTFGRNRSCRVKIREWEISWNNTQPKSTRANLEKLAKVKKKPFYISFWFPAFQVKMAGHHVNLSVIGALQQNRQGFFMTQCLKTPKTPFLKVFGVKNAIFSL